MPFALDIKTRESLEFRVAIGDVINSFAISAELSVWAIEYLTWARAGRYKSFRSSCQIQHPKIAISCRSIIGQDHLAIVQRPVKSGPVLTIQLCYHPIALRI